MERLRDIGRILSWIVSTWPRRSKRRNPIEEAHAFFAERLTDSGKTVGWLWLASLPLAMVPGTLGWVVFASLSALLVVSFAATLRSPALQVQYLGGGRAVAGAPVEMRLRVTNPTNKPVKWAGAGLFRAALGLEGRDRVVVVDVLESGAFADVTISVRCDSRGPTGFPGIAATRSDPFGLTRARRIEFKPLDVLVAPKPVRIVASTFLFGGASGRTFVEAAGLGSDVDRVFQGVRAFREGDRLRDLDHKAWARWNSPVVREFASAPARGIALAVDTGCEGLLERSLVEPMLRLACAIAVEFCRNGWLGGIRLDGRWLEARWDSVEEVERLFAGIERCGWGKWPGKPRGLEVFAPAGMPVLGLAVSAKVGVSESVQEGAAPKRILVVPRRGEVRVDSRTLLVVPGDLDLSEVVL